MADINALYEEINRLRAEVAALKQQLDERHRGKGRPSKLTPALMQEIKDRHDAGESIRKLAAAFGLSSPTIQKALKGAIDNGGE